MIRKLKQNVENWKFARSLSLSAIVTTGVLCSGAVAALSVSHQQKAACSGAALVSTGYTYAGIGVELEQRGHHVVVRRVFSDTPAATKLMPGAILTSVNGAHPSHVRDWQRAIRGDVGTPLELEVEYPGLGHRSVILKRDLIHLRVR